MLREWALYLGTPAPAHLRRLGYLRESVSLQARSRRCRTAWAPHLAASRAVVRAAFADLRSRRRAVVLGSGLLDDVPLADLAAAFTQVVLVDAVHPWPARVRARRHANVARATIDLGGTGRWLLGEGPIESDPLAGACAGADFVLSANLLSQLPILPIDRFESRGLSVPPGLGAGIVAAHLAALDRLGARVCLITDIDAREEDRAGAVTDRLDLMHGIALPEAVHTWDWELAPFGEAARHRRLIHRVRAYPDWAAARCGSGSRAPT
ncbi:hypothetical protein [uncultured Methylobacterium sp.]|uniref:hypothetical protein n=1 Tax=uncultured Methylobacterium sp. TaxID=157278 RepID=UPI0035C98ECA